MICDAFNCGAPAAFRIVYGRNPAVHVISSYCRPHVLTLLHHNVLTAHVTAVLPLVGWAP